MIDRTAAALLVEAGAGATITVSLGGRSTPLFAPLPVTGVVRAVGDGVVDAPISRRGASTWAAALAFDVGRVTVLVTEHAGAGGIRPGRVSAGQHRPGDHQMVVMKTASNFPVHGAAQLGVIRVATPGPTQSDLTALPWQRAPRPIFPLDEPATWRG